MALTKNEIRLAEKYSHITKQPEYQLLKSIPRHGNTNTYEHSIRVAYAAYRLARKMGVDPESAALVGLLHDFCLINYHDRSAGKVSRSWYCLHHPEEALQNASRILELSKEEQKAILSHMFPLALHVPSSSLALVLTLADKQVATAEGISSAAETCLGAGKTTGKFVSGKLRGILEKR